MLGKLRNVNCFLFVLVLSCFVFIQPAISDELADQQTPINQYGVRSSNPYVTERFVEDGNSIDVVIVPGPPTPPQGFVRAEVFSLPEPHPEAGINILSNVPALSWSFGCSATSAAMMFGYYDNKGYANMYTGPTNGGVFPMTNDPWGGETINGEWRDHCPLSATAMGVDGRAIMGHVDDYWVKYGSAAADPFIGYWTEHTKGECTADFMGTNQYWYGNSDGSTTFFYYSNGARIYDYTGYEPTQRDGCHGLKLFAQSRGYSVVTNYSQYIYGYNGNTQGFTFADFKNEIDAGRPVLIHVTGHTMLGIGYDDVDSTMYIHDSWDHNDHTMTWGGSYSGMQHMGVSVLQLTPTEPASTPTAYLLWSHTSGKAGLWTLDASGNRIPSGDKNWGPYDGWTATSYQKLGDGTAKILWSHTSGKAGLWTLDASGKHVPGDKIWGPYDGWTATSYQKLDDGTARILWSHTSGLAGMWTLDTNNNRIPSGDKNWGPYPGWTAWSYEKLDASTAKLLWSHTSGLSGMWTLDANENRVPSGDKSWGPYPDWTSTCYQ